MKKIELVIEPAAFDRFTESAEGLNLCEPHVTELHRTTRRFYHGREALLDLVDRLKIDFTVADEAATRIAHELIENVQPESLAIMRLDQAAPVIDEAAVRSTRSTPVPTDAGIGRSAPIQ